MSSNEIVANNYCTHKTSTLVKLLGEHGPNLPPRCSHKSGKIIPKHFPIKALSSSTPGSA